MGSYDEEQLCMTFQAALGVVWSVDWKDFDEFIRLLIKVSRLSPKRRIGWSNRLKPGSPANPLDYLLLWQKIDAMDVAVDSSVGGIVGFPGKNRLKLSTTVSSYFTKEMESRGKGIWSFGPLVTFLDSDTFVCGLEFTHLQWMFWPEIMQLSEAQLAWLTAEMLKAMFTSIKSFGKLKGMSKM